jgi:hypothetical protein
MNVIKEMIRLADSLDRKGLRKEADYLDGIVKKLAGEMVMPGAATEQIMAGKVPVKVPRPPTTETPSHVRSQVGPNMKEVKKNPGDPFDYVYNAEGDYFEVVGAPGQHAKSLRARITSSSNPEAYKALMDLNPGLKPPLDKAPEGSSFHLGTAWEGTRKPLY